MRFDFLRQPVAGDSPCGPDLNEAGDADFSIYVMDAKGRLPDRFLDENRRPFDKTTFKRAVEAKQIADLLKRTYDLRLLTLDAQISALTGSFIECLEAVQAAEILVVSYWDDVHPQRSDGDFGLRQAVLEDFADMGRVILPLQHAALISGGRQRPISYRNYLVASGKALPRDEEEQLDLGGIVTDFGKDDNAPQLKTVLGAVRLSLASLEAIRSAFHERKLYGDSPNFERLVALLTEIAALIVELHPTVEEDELAAPATDEPGEGVAVADGTAPAPKPGAIPDRASAAAALLAVEDYFRTSEPSSPALILVHVARSLIGRSFVEALNVLMPGPAEKAVMRFGTEQPFEINLEMMRAATDGAFGRTTETQEVDPTSATPISGPVPVATSRPEAAALIQAAETYFRTAEPSSSLPTLLAKARGYLNRDFTSLLNEMIGKT